MSETSFFMAEEAVMGERFLAEGYIIAPVEDRHALDRIQVFIATVAAKTLGVSSPLSTEAGNFLDTIEQRVTPETLNEFRLAVMGEMNAAPWFRPAYYALARQALAVLVGNELAMQRRINLSIQLPDDDSSLLPIHADVWSGDSPFEIVLWLPLMDCHRTKSMYILPPIPNAALQQNIGSVAGKSAEDIFLTVESDVRFLDIKFGQMLLFSQNLLHGNRVNREAGTRWSMNCRFKGVFTPYADKRLGEFFEPITLRAATRLGLDYQLPQGLPDES
jgi:sporadic carbohydrate cluster 2OG-Fe(II) oxygenase